MNQRRPLGSLANEVLIVMNIERWEDTHSHHITSHYSHYALAAQLLITQASNPTCEEKMNPWLRRDSVSSISVFPKFQPKLIQTEIAASY